MIILFGQKGEKLLDVPEKYRDCILANMKHSPEYEPIIHINNQIIKEHIAKISEETYYQQSNVKMICILLFLVHLLSFCEV
jgi:hypothetical protein